MGSPDAVPPAQTLFGLFLRFLRFGLMAWGGPVVQIGMLRDELVERERWITPERFRRVFAVYQALPGPEAHELCVYFGYVARGRWGGLVAGLGFMLPGFALMFALSWLYVEHGLGASGAVALFYGLGPAVVALVIRAVRRLGGHVLVSRGLWAIAAAGAAATLLGVPFWLTLPVGGVASVALLLPRGPLLAALLLTALLVGGLWSGYATGLASERRGAPREAGLVEVAASGLRTGLLTFGGAYTAIPFLQQDAIVEGGWIDEQQFVDGLAMSSVLPAPLIIFATFVGYVGAGPLGALLMTAGIFLPAFAFTLIGHGLVERLVSEPRLHALLDGIGASVLGLIAVAALGLARVALVDVVTVCICALVLLALTRWRARLAIPAAVAAAGLLGLAADTLGLAGRGAL